MFEKLIQWNAKLVRWNPKKLAKWEHVRAKGKPSYVWFHGVLAWGVHPRKPGQPGSSQNPPGRGAVTP